MATKLRSFSTGFAAKAAASVLTIIAMTWLVVLVQIMYYKGMDPECLFVKDYIDSKSFAYQIRNAAEDASNTLLSHEAPTDNVSYFYYISDGSSEWTNVENPGRSFFEQFGSSFCSLENGQWSFRGKTGFDAVGYVANTLTYKDLIKKNSTIYIAYPDDFIQARQLKWQNDKSYFMPLLITAAIGILLAFILVAYLAAVTGRRPHDMELHPGRIDSVYSDILVITFALLIAIWYKMVREAFLLSPSTTGTLGLYYIVPVFVIAAATSAVFAICGVILLSLIRKIKAGKLIKHSLVYSFIYRIHDFAVSLFDGRTFSKYPLTRSLFYRQLLFISLSFIFIISTLLLFLVKSYACLVPPVLEVIMIYFYIKGNNKTYMEINKGFNESLEEQMKSERMKVALITNVSHDLKTPLTSIISYIDLLSKEEDLSETAKDYVRILTEKSSKLINIVSDLFDLSKSTSGNMPVDFENLDLKKLIEQTLADMDDRIEKSGLSFKIKLPEKPINIFADGKKLYRVFQNIIDNALKYSLQGTRVYISLEESNGSAVATVKNTAGYEMDFTVEEIMQRFSRGDKSRTTEGSGLGLSIAESYTKLCGGSFKADIDGDLFKVTISFSVAEK